MFLGLFQKAIFQSGIATCDWAVKEDQPESFGLASLFGKDSQDPVEVAEFLRTIPAAVIAEAQHKVSHVKKIILYIFMRLMEFI